MGQRLLSHYYSNTHYATYLLIQKNTTLLNLFRFFWFGWYLQFFLWVDNDDEHVLDYNYFDKSILITTHVLWILYFIQHQVLISTISSVKNIRNSFIQFHFVVLGCELITTSHNNVNQDKAVITEVKTFFFSFPLKL